MNITRNLINIGIGLALTGLLVLPVTAAAGNGNANGSGRGNSGQCTASIINLPAGELSEQETATLLHMREEEKLARDVYLALYEQWGLGIFANIARSEQRHMDTLKILIDKYGLTDPVADDAPGAFTDSDLKVLYEEFIADGQVSLVEALTVGATIEDLDIYDLQAALAQSDDEDVRIACQNLMKGSRNHLRAFVYQLNRNGAEYTPEYISAETYESIISSPKERGSVNQAGEPAVGAGCNRKGPGCRGGCPFLSSRISTDMNGLLLSRGGNGRGGGNGGGRGPGDGTGNGGNGPKDGSGNGKKTGTCIYS